MSYPTSFEIYLVSPPGSAPAPERILAHLARDPRLRPSRQDPGRYLFQDEHTGTLFHVTVTQHEGRQDLPRPGARWQEEGVEEGLEEEMEGEREGELEERGEDGFEGELDRQRGAGGRREARDLRDEPAGRALRDEGEDEDEEEGEGEGSDPELAAISIFVPLLAPRFFGRVAASYARELAGALGLLVEHLALSTAAQGEVATEVLEDSPTLEARWDEMRRQAPLHLRMAGPLCVWPQEKAARLHAFGSARPALLAELEREGVALPTIQAARFGDEVLTLTTWDATRPAALPRTDLVLVRRARLRKGLFFSKQVLEEGLILGAEAWDILAPFSEIRREPVEVLIFREASRPPQQLAAALEGLVLRPLTEARKTELVGVVESDAERRTEEAT